MKNFLRNFLVYFGICLFLVSCSQKEKPPPSKEDYMGQWQLIDPKGNTYLMTLEPDGSGKTTREGGEFGSWEFKNDHIETQWSPKTMRLYFNSGQTEPLLNPAGGPEKTGP